MNSSAFTFYKFLGLLISAAIALLSGIIGYIQGADGQLIIFYSIATFSLILWAWHFLSVKWTYAKKTGSADVARVNSVDAEAHESGYLGQLIRNNRWIVGVAIALAVLFAVLSFALDGFFSWVNAFIFLALIVFFVLAYWLSTFVTLNKSAFIGCAILLALFIAGSFVIEGFASSVNIKDRKSVV